MSSYEDTMINSMISIWQEPLNELLKEKGASYQVKMISYTNKGENDQINNLKKLKKNGEQTDIITVFPETGGEDKMISWNNIYKNAVNNNLLLNLNGWKKKNEKILEKVLTPYDFELSKINNRLFGISSIVPVTMGIDYNKELLDKYGLDISEIKSNVYDNEEIFTRVKEQSGKTPISYLGVSTLALGLYIVNPVNNLAFKKGEGFISITRSDEFKRLIQNAFKFKEQELTDEIYIDRNSSTFATRTNQVISKKEMFNVNFESATKTTEFVTVPDY